MAPARRRHNLCDMCATTGPATPRGCTMPRIWLRARDRRTRVKFRLHLTLVLSLLLAGTLLAITSAWLPARLASATSGWTRIAPGAAAHFWRLSFIPESSITTWFERRAPGVRVDEVWYTMWSTSSPGAAQGSTFVSAGWPVPCLQMRDSPVPAWTGRGGTAGGTAFTGPPYSLPSAPVPATTISQANDWWSYGLQFGGRRYPLRPLPLAFAVNTLLWTIPVIVVYALLLWVRARRRRSRGLCPACAYPVANLVACPECGTRTRSGGYLPPPQKT